MDSGAHRWYRLSSAEQDAAISAILENCGCGMTEAMVDGVTGLLLEWRRIPDEALVFETLSYTKRFVYVVDFADDFSSFTCVFFNTDSGDPPSEPTVIDRKEFLSGEEFSPYTKEAKEFRKLVEEHAASQAEKHLHRLKKVFLKRLQSI